MAAISSGDPVPAGPRGAAAATAALEAAALARNSSAATPVVPAAAAAGPPRPRKWGRRLRHAALVLVATAVGMGASLAFGVRPSSPAAEPSAAEHAATEHTPAEPAVPADPHPTVVTVPQRIDLLIRSRRFKDALQLCRGESPHAPAADEHAEHAPPGHDGNAEGEHADHPEHDAHAEHAADGHGPVDPALAYREGLCLEALGRWKEADAAYRRVADGDDTTPGWARAALGRVRCAAATGDLPAARALLSRVVLRSGHAAHRTGHVLEECLFLRGRLELLDLGPRAAPDPLDATAVAWPPLTDGLDEYPVWLTATDPPPAPAHDHKPAAHDDHGHKPAAKGGHEHAHEAKDDHGHAHAPAHTPVRVAIHHYTWVPGRYEVTAHVPASPVPDLLTAVGVATGWAVRIDGDAASRLTGGGTVAVDVDRAPLPDVLTALTEPYGVGWSVDGPALVIGTPPPPDRAARRDAAGAALRQAVAVAPTHPAARAARVAVANLDFDAGRLRVAGDGYRQFLEDAPHAPPAVYAAFNLGLTELRQGSLAAARARFLDVVDYAPLTPWEDAAWWWIGRTHLDAWDTAAARKPLRTALAGKTKPVRLAATLALAAADLLDGDDDAARARLRGTKFPQREGYAATADWFASLVRYRLAPSEGRAEVVQAALHEAANGRALGPAGVYLAGQSYSEAGQPERMVAVYEAAAGTARGPFGTRMVFDAAAYFDSIDRRAPARQRYLTVAAADPTGLGPRAELRAADLAARDGRGAECVSLCRRAAGRPGIDANELLAVMGRGFELEGEYRRAAECFAGRLPAE